MRRVLGPTVRQGRREFLYGQLQDRKKEEIRVSMASPGEGTMNQAL
jgi:hypothetical protein